MSLAEKGFRPGAVLPEEMHRTHERELIVRALRRRAAKREESLVTAEQAMEGRMLRRIATMIEDGTEGHDP